MAKTLISFWPEEMDLSPQAGAGGLAADSGLAGLSGLPGLGGPAAKPALSLTILDAEGEPLAEPIAVKRPRARRMETPGEGGTMGWSKVVPPLSLEVPELEGAESLLLRAGSLTQNIPFAQAALGDPGAPVVRTFGAASGWTLLLVSEMYADQERFFAHCKQLFDFILGEPPFGETAVRNRFRAEALFWPSGPGGLFNTRFQTSLPDDRRCFGEGKLVRKLLKKAGKKGNKVMVLIDSGRRGGAGGVGKDPAWSTITGSAGEAWEGIALHELGHSLGLADEYVASGPKGKPKEPNVSRERDAARAPWAAMRSSGIPHNPTCKAGQDCSALAGKVGTFEGARYQPKDLYRPSWDCRMHHTTADFCAVCQAHIRTVLTS